MAQLLIREGDTTPRSKFLSTLFMVCLLACYCCCTDQVYATDPNDGSTIETKIIVADTDATVWAACHATGARPTSVLSETKQTALEEAMKSAAIEDAVLDGFYPTDHVGGQWLWMADDWSMVNAVAFFDRYTVTYHSATPIPGIYSNFGKDSNGTVYPAEGNVVYPTWRNVYATAKAIPAYAWFNGKELMAERACDYVVTTPKPTSKPPIPTKPPTTSQPKEEKGKKFPDWAIAVIVVGVVVIVAVVLVIVLCLCCDCSCRESREARERRKAAQARREEMAEQRRVRPPSRMERIASARLAHMNSAASETFSRASSKSDLRSFEGYSLSGSGTFETAEEREANNGRNVQLLRRGSVSFVLQDDEVNTE